MMKRIVSVFLILIMVAALLPATAVPVQAGGDVPLTSAYFPDSVFRNFIADNFDQDSDGALSVEEQEHVEGINVNVLGEKKIYSVQGIEYFPNLKTLNCAQQNLESLDISQNIYLEELNCEENNLTELDVTGNACLREIFCGCNYIYSIDTTKCSGLKILSCECNQLTSLNVTKNTTLRTLNCNGNSISQLDLHNNPILEDLMCSDNNLTSIDVKKHYNLLSLYISNNKLTSIDLSDNDDLHFLECDYNNITELDFSNIPHLVELRCAGNKLTTLDVSDKINLQTVDCSNNSLKTLYIWGSTSLYHLYCQHNKLTTLEVGGAPRIQHVAQYGTKSTVEDYDYYFDSSYWEYLTIDPTVDIRDKTYIDTVLISIDAPVAGVKPEYKATFPAGARYTDDGSSSGTFQNGIMWRDMTDEYDMDVDSAIFEEGHVYRFRIYLKPDIGCEFVTTTTVTAYVNGNKASVRYSEEDGLLQVQYTFKAAVACPFKDVPADASYMDALMWAYTNGIVNGTSATTFSPNANCTRQEFAAMLWKMNGKPSAAGLSNPFKDVSEKSSFRNPIVWCYHNGIVAGTSATTFSPKANITRWQLIVMLWRMVGKPQPTMTTNPFKDVKTTANYYKAALWAYEKGITAVKTFKPNDYCTRWQLVVFLQRLNNLYHYV